MNGTTLVLSPRSPGGFSEYSFGRFILRSIYYGERAKRVLPERRAMSEKDIRLMSYIGGEMEMSENG